MPVEPIRFAEFQKGIAPLWYADSDPASIPIYNNPYQIIAYPEAEQRHRVIFLPVRYSEDGVVKGYSSVYNISDSILRVRGIYVLPEHRGKGVGHRMMREMVDLWPKTFYRVVGFWRENSYARFMRHSGMKIVPGTDWIWSEFSKVNMRMLYWDRAERPTESNLGCNRFFIRENLYRFGFGGRFNLNREWTDEEWSTFVAQNRGNYEPLGINLDFE